MTGSVSYTKIINFKTFFSVARHLSFSEAAKELHLSPTLISKNIIRLEKELDMQLLERTTRKVLLTPGGEYLYLNAQKYVEGLESCYHAAYKVHHESINTVALGVVNTADMAKFLFPYTDVYHEEHPDKTINIISDSMTTLMNGIQYGQYDAVLVPDFLINMSERNHLHWRWWAKDKSNVLIPKSKPLSEKENVSLSDLQNEIFSFIGGATNEEYASYIYSIFRPYNEHIKLGKTYSNPYTLRDTFEKDDETIFFCDKYFSYSKEDSSHIRLLVRDHSSGIIIVWKKNQQSVKDFIHWHNDMQDTFTENISP